jgi:hypothetical protein
VLKETETMLDATSPETAPVDVCGSCGLTGGAHEPQCPEEPF